MHTSTGVHHLHKRKRIYQKHEPYPHPNRVKRVVDGFAMLMGVVGPAFTVPQLVKIWSEQNAAGVSAASWIGYTFIAVFWLAYGIIHREPPLILTYSIVLILNILVVAGTLLYG